MQPSDLAGAPWVRQVRIQEERGLAGEWVDFDHVLVFVERGRGDYLFDGLRLGCAAGTALLMPPGVRHVVRSPAGQPFTQFIAHFDWGHDPARAVVREIGTKAGPRRPAPEASPFAGTLPAAALPAPAAAAFRARFAELRRACAGGDLADHLRRRACLLDLLALVLEHGAGATHAAPAARPSRAWAALDRAVRCMQARLDDPGLDLAAVARGAGLSRAYLPELFRVQLGTSVRRYLLHLRVRRARELLAGGASVTATAEACGFSGIHAFSRAFHRATGVPPSAAADPPPG